MLKHLLAILASLGLALTPAPAQDTKAKKAADTAAAEAKKGAAKAAEEARKAVEPAKKKDAPKKTGELSDSDKALLAHAEKETARLTDTQRKKLLDLVNGGDEKALEAIPGVGEVKAKAIKKARPVRAVPDLIMIDGIGEVTFDDIVKWARGGMKTDAPAGKKTEPAKPAKETPAKKKAG